jgi:hypothetical protein
MEHEHVYRAKLDFLYQSIAVYAATIVIYLIIRNIIAVEVFPSFWQDPILLLLGTITLVSVLALLYNLLMRRQIEITPDEIRFTSRVRQRVIERTGVRYMQFGRERGPIKRKGVRIVKIVLRERRRPIRIRFTNFEHGKQFLLELKEWAGPLAITRQKMAHSRRANSGNAPLGEHPIL